MPYVLCLQLYLYFFFVGLTFHYFINLRTLCSTTVLYYCFLKNKAIPHRLDVGFAPSFSPIKGGSPSIINYTSPHPLKLICSITQLFWVFIFALIS